MALLEVDHLSVTYAGESGPVRAVRDVSLALEAGETLALAGETGCGKSTLAQSLLGLLDDASVAGRITFDGMSLVPGKGRAWRGLRGRRIGMAFQDARGALNPVLTVGAQLTEALRAHRRLTRSAARAAAVALLREVGIPDPDFFLRRYPMELSGGMCQRVAIAIAACNGPSLLVADEPTSALDPSIQSQILELLQTLKARHRMALLLISHDLSLVSEVSERVAVMYHGSLVETGGTAEVFRTPAHPYTRALLACQPDLRHRWDGDRLAAIGGAPPAAEQEFPGCSFAPRCARAVADCARSAPLPVPVGEGHWAACSRLEPDGRHTGENTGGQPGITG
jgi:oligopeptide/dipeptide ABC transporter ATP-binding protein